MLFQLHIIFGNSLLCFSHNLVGLECIKGERVILQHLELTVKHRSSDQLSSGKIVKFPKLSWSGNKLVRNFVGRNKLVRMLLVPELLAVGRDQKHYT